MNHSFPRIPCSPGKDSSLETCENCGLISRRYKKGGRQYQGPGGRFGERRPYPCSLKEAKRNALAKKLDQMVNFYGPK